MTLVEEANRAVPKAKPPCPKCAGAGSYYEPPLAVQEREVEYGDREVITKRVCTCIQES